MDFKRFLDEFYQGQKNSVVTDYVNVHWDEALELFGDSPIIFDGLSEICIRQSKERYDETANRLIEIYETTQDFSSFEFEEIGSPHELEILKQENQNLKQQVEMTQGAVMDLATMILSQQLRG